METNHSPIALESADEPASFVQQLAPCGEPPASANSPLAPALLESTLGDTFPPGSRKPRHDGFTPEKIGDFLRALASTGIVAHAAAEVGLSASAAYALRNRRQGRAFAAMWDAVLIHRSRARLAAEVQARSLTGCVTVRKEQGEIVSELHFHDNRLAMAVLTRLDRLAEREAPRDEQLRALSEDLDAFIDCLAEGEDPVVFVEARKPTPPTPADPPAAPVDEDPHLTRYALASGCPHYLDVPRHRIEILDLDVAEFDEWAPDQRVRAERSGFMAWLRDRDEEDTERRGAAIQFHYERLAAYFARERLGDTEETPVDAWSVEVDDLDTDSLFEWSEDQLARAGVTRLFQALPEDFWEELAEEHAAHGGGA
jgi:hypothetical protein